MSLPPLAELLPHAAPSILLDRVVSWHADRVTVRTEIRADSAWCGEAGVPAHVAMEYMAQACATFVGMEGHNSGAPPKVGLLLGTRDFRATRPWFARGETLDVEAVLVFRDSQMGVFDCRVQIGRDEVCRAQLTVVQPDDLAAVLGGTGATGD